jgi:hypothetical protein
MCGAPERPVVTTIMNYKVQLINPLNLGELFAAYSRTCQETSAC